MTSFNRAVNQHLGCAPFRDKILHPSPIHQHVPRTALVLERPGAERRQVQSLRHLPEPGGEAAVVDVSVIARVELVEQTLDVSFGDAELAAHRREILVLDPAGLVHVAGGEEPPEIGSGSVHRIRTRTGVTSNPGPMNPAPSDGPTAGVREALRRRSLVWPSLWAWSGEFMAQISTSGPGPSAAAAAGVYDHFTVIGATDGAVI